MMTHVRRAIQELTVNKIRPSTDIDLIGLYLLFACMHYSRIYDYLFAFKGRMKRILESILRSRKQSMPCLDRTKYPILEHILVACCDPGDHSSRFWKRRAFAMTPNPPPIFDNYVSEFSALYLDTRWRTTPEDTRKELIWYDLITRNYMVARKAFLHVLSVESGQNPTVSPLAIQAMEDYEALQCQFEKSETYTRLFRECWLRPLNLIGSRGTYWPLNRWDIFYVISRHYIIRLLAILVLRVRFVQYSCTSNEVLLAAKNLITWAEQVGPVAELPWWLFKEISFGILCACLVHILSKDSAGMSLKFCLTPKVRVKMLSLLEQFCGEEMAALVTRYWDDPDTHYWDVILRLLSFWDVNIK